MKIYTYKGVWNNTLFVFLSDNGGTVRTGNNYPLRGAKTSLLEGGIRNVGFISGGWLNDTRKGQISNQMISIVDWFPTICDIVGINCTRLVVCVWTV